MSNAVLCFPVVPGKTEQDIRRIADRFKDDPEGYRQSRAKGGVSLERAFWQHTPMGDFVVAYVESDMEITDGLAAIASDTSEMGRFFVENVKEVHGVDIAQASAGPAPEIVGQWVDPQATGRGKGMAFSAPLIPDQLEQGRRFAHEAFETRKDEFTQSRRALGGTREVVCINHSPHGPICCVYIEGENPTEINRRFAASQEPFDVWFKDQCKIIFPPYVDFNEPVPGITEIFDSVDA